MGEYLALAMFPVLLIALFLGFPVAFSMMGVALFFGLITFGEPVIFQFVQKVDAVATAFELAAVPLFIFMGAMMERSGMAEKLFEAIHLWTRRLPGGLAIGTIVMCVVFAASSGVIGATETVVGMLAIPVMMKYAYDKGLISGTICAGGSLGTIIPPSVVVVVLGPVADVSVGTLFVGMIFPGLILAGLYLTYILVWCTIQPSAGPRLPRSDDEPSLWEKIRISIIALVPPVIMIISVLGSIMFGLAAPTEAAGLGALGSMLLAISYGQFSLSVLHEAVVRTLRVTCMIYPDPARREHVRRRVHCVGRSSSHRAPYRGGTARTGNDPGCVPDSLFYRRLFSRLDLGSAHLHSGLYPDREKHGFDPAWFCVLFLIVIQTSYLTPPMAPAIFYLRGISPPEITLRHMFSGVIPFIVLQIICLAIVAVFPNLVLWLPDQLLGFR